MNTIDIEDPGITVTELPDLPFDATFRGLLTAYTAEGYEQGYTRGTRDLLAVYPLLIEQFLNRQSDVPPSLRETIHSFGRYVEDYVGQRLSTAGFVEGGLGI